MKKKLFGVSIVTVLVIMAGVGTLIFAQEQKTEQSPSSTVILMGGLKLKEGVDQVEAEKLFNEYLIPAMKDVKGVNMKVLKKMPMPNEKTDTGSVDYIMMAEVADPLTLMQIMNSQNMDPRLKTFGDMMKQYADGPALKVFTVIANTDEPKETE